MNYEWLFTGSGLMTWSKHKTDNNICLFHQKVIRKSPILSVSFCIHDNLGKFHNHKTSINPELDKSLTNYELPYHLIEK